MKKLRNVAAGLALAIGLSCSIDGTEEPVHRVTTTDADAPHEISNEPTLPEGFEGTPRETLPLTAEEQQAMSQTVELIRLRSALSPELRGIATPPLAEVPR